MFSRTIRVLACAALAALVLAPARAQSTLYRLTSASDYTQGCYPPCACPIFLVEDLLGTFHLTYDFSDPAGFDHYKVENVLWVFTQGPEDHYVAGQGEYVFGGQVAVQQEMQLDLSVDGGALQHFDSGLIPAGTPFPNIDVEVSLNGMVCFDKVFHLVSSPIPATQIAPYLLKRSAYQEGCLPPCLCMLVLWRTQGNFGFVALGANGTTGRQDYALVDIVWGTQPNPPVHSWTGQGIYSLDPALGRHRLVLDLVEPTNGAQRFDSAWVPGGGTFPRIDIDAAVNAFTCFDFVHKVHARPQ